MKFKFIIPFILFTFYNCYSQLPEEFIYVKNEIPTIKTELRYFSENNFVGKKIRGYTTNNLILTKKSAAALKNIQKELEPLNLSLKIYDGYRPQQAVDHFWEWAQDLNDTLMKKQFYPNVEKKDLFKLKYIAKKSGHSRGSTVDVTLVNTSTCKEIDMGTPYDFFGEESWVEYIGITKEQQKNRRFLQQLMLKNGFINYPQEWWHFTLANEPFINQYFNFEIE